MEEIFNKWASTIPAEIRAEVAAKLQRCEGADAVLALAEKYHLPMTEETAHAIALYVSDPKLLGEDDMKLVAGGTLATPWSDACDTIAGCETDDCPTHNQWCNTYSCTDECSSGD